MSVGIQLEGTKECNEYLLCTSNKRFHPKCKIIKSYTVHSKDLSYEYMNMNRKQEEQNYSCMKFSCDWTL